MNKKILDFESKKEMYLFGLIVGILILLLASIFYPSVRASIDNKMMELKVNDVRDKMDLEPAKSPEDYYKLFQCSCCGQPIDADCCGMAKQRKDYLDKLLLQGLNEQEIIYEMVKNFGFDVLMDSSMEDQVKDYIRSHAGKNPPELTLERISYDFGTISQMGGNISTDFTITNTGKSDLIIHNLEPSCMCTTASLIYNGVEGPISSMIMDGSSPVDYDLTIPPGKSAILKVYYDPLAHGKQTKPEVDITREVTIISNDPVNIQQKVRFELKQVK